MKMLKKIISLISIIGIPCAIYAADLVVTGNLPSVTKINTGNIISNGTTTINNGVTVWFLAKDGLIRLTPGFKVSAGGNFHAVAGDLLDVDSDNNGMADGWEWEHFGKLGNDPNADPDGDGLTNLQESLYLTDPKVKTDLNDSDNDGIADEWEIANFGNLSQDVNSDYDGDGVTDYNEFIAGTAPTDANDKPASGRYYQYDNKGRLIKIILIP